MAASRDDDDDEWEYEYDENETEDYYVTLDLSAIATAVTTAPKSNQQVSRLRQPTSGTEEAGDETDAAAQQDDDTPNDNGTLSKDEESNVTPREQLQILDLDSDNPIVSYRGKLLSCHWGTSLGTDLFFADADIPSDPAHPPLRALSSFNLLGGGSARLVATDVDLIPRAASNKPVENTSIANQIGLPPGATTGNANSTSTIQPPRQPIKIAVRDAATNYERNQARFLERLDALKAARGDKDKVSLARGYRSKHAPASASANMNNNNQQEDTNAEEAEDAEGPAQEADVTETPDSIVRRNRPSRRTKAALFGAQNQFRHELQGVLTGRGGTGGGLGPAGSRKNVRRNVGREVGAGNDGTMDEDSVMIGVEDPTQRQHDDQDADAESDPDAEMEDIDSAPSISRRKA